MMTLDKMLLIPLCNLLEGKIQIWVYLERTVEEELI